MMKNIPVSDDYDNYEIYQKIKKKSSGGRKTSKRKVQKKNIEKKRDDGNNCIVTISVDSSVLNLDGSSLLIECLTELSKEKDFICVELLLKPHSTMKDKAEKICWKVRSRGLSWGMSEKDDFSPDSPITKNNVLITGNDVLAVAWLDANGKAILCKPDRVVQNFLMLNLENDDIMKVLKQYIHLD